MHMSGSEESTDDYGGESGSGRSRESSSETDVAGWFAASTFRVALAIIGLVLLLFALGQAVGFDLLGLVADALSSRLGRWLAVAFFALILIVVAVRGFDTQSA